jgi:RNA polymerase subunit RPABC4/transcription elongation factor Spt4
VTGSLFGGAHDFFHSSAWAVTAVGVGLFVLLFWAATVYWVWKDARRRSKSGLKIGLATALGVIVPFVGPLIYMLFRPPEYLEDVRERELEMRAIERRLGGGELSCHVCGASVEEDFLVCPVCTARLRQACTNCHRPLEASWQLCPYCETPVAEQGPVPLRGPSPDPLAQRRSGTSR